MRNVKSTLFALLAASGSLHAEMALNLTPGVTPVSQDIFHLHMTVFWLCVIIGIGVFGVMFYSIAFHRKSRGAKPADFHSHTWLEITWTIIPAIILIVMAIPATKVFINMNNNDKEEINIKIVGYQWKWQYEYLEDGIKFFSNLSTPIDQQENKAPKGDHYLREVDNEIVVPIHKKIRFLVTSNDVNHSWWVPDLGIKRDAIPGIVNEAWARIDKPGTYTGQCAELCGVKHAYMPIVIKAVSEAEYKDWVAKQKGGASQSEADTNRAWTMQELMKKGEETYGRICAACHQVTGAGLPPTFPALKGSKIATGPLAGHADIVLNGKAGTAMQAFKGQLSESELAAVITYERNAWGNNKGDMIQPIQVKALKEGKSIEEALKIQPSATAAAATTAAPAASLAEAAQKEEAKEEAKAAESTPAAKALSPEDALKEAMTRGEKVYLNTCAACHQPNGEGMPPMFKPLKNSPIAKGPVKDHIKQVLNGKQGTAMQAFKDQLNDQDIADVITYERNAWGNNTKDLVKPDDIKAQRSVDTNK